MASMADKADEKAQENIDIEQTLLRGQNERGIPEVRFIVSQAKDCAVPRVTSCVSSWSIAGRRGVLPGDRSEWRSGGDGHRRVHHAAQQVPYL
eukprot:scaffold2141_cov282-Pinguiococcus_pyrenoidosus.AAC.28